MAHTKKARNTAARPSPTPIASAVFLSLLGISAHAQAQTAAPEAAAAPQVAASAPAGAASAAPTADPLQLQSIVVTANRRIEKLEKVPQSISVVSTEDIERNNVREFADLTSLAPALSISVGTQVGTNSINMRGIGTTSNNLGIEGDVALILDDLPFAQPQQAFTDLADVARVEVLKGPQSTLFGKSAIAGAVVMSTAPIGSGPMQGKVSTYLTNDGEYRVGGSVSGRVSDEFGLRLSASKTEFRGLLHNLHNDTYINGSGGTNFLGKFQWNPNANLDVSLYTLYSDTLATGNVSVLTAMEDRVGSLIKNNTYLTNTNIFQGITASVDNRDVRMDDPTQLAQTNKTVALRANYAFPDDSLLAGHTLTSITGVNRNNSNDRRDNDRTALNVDQYQPLTDANGVTGNTPSGILGGEIINGYTTLKTLTQDLRLTSPDSGKFRYLAGLWYSDMSTDRTYLRGLYGIKSSNYTNYLTTLEARNLAVYGNTTWEFLPDHTLTLGGRYGQETSNYSFTTVSALASSAPANTPYKPYLATTLPQHQESAFTGKAAYSYQLTPETMVYASYATGRKGVAYDMTSGANNANVFAYLPLAAETAKSKEIGLKANLFNNRATFNLALFQEDFENYQASATQTFSDGSSASVLYGIPAVQTHGVEFDIKALLTRELTVSANYAYTAASVTNWPFGACYSGRTDCTKTPPNPQNPNASYHDGAGFAMPNSPRNKGMVSAQYASQLGQYKAQYDVQVRSQSDVQGSIDQNPTNFRPGNTIVNAGFSLATPDSRYKLSFSIKNLFDQRYSVGGQGGVVGTLFAPSTDPNKANISQNGWIPARDAFRYYSVRFDMKF